MESNLGTEKNAVFVLFTLEESRNSIWIPATLIHSKKYKCIMRLLRPMEGNFVDYIASFLRPGNQNSGLLGLDMRFS